MYALSRRNALVWDPNKPMLHSVIRVPVRELDMAVAEHLRLVALLVVAFVTYSTDLSSMRSVTKSYSRSRPRQNWTKSFVPELHQRGVSILAGG